MNLSFSRAPIGGTIRAMSSKSQAHRLMLCAALADRPTRLFCPDTSRDMEATAACLRALGAQLERQGDWLTIHPISAPPASALLDCGESGSTLRFLLPVVAALGVRATFRLHGRLASRPLSPLWEELEAHGCRLRRCAPDSLLCEGQLSGGSFCMAGNVSSQFITGLLLALPLLGGGTLALTTALESASYVRLTTQTMAAFGISVREEAGRWHCAGSYRSPGTAHVEGDWSNAAFWLCAGALSRPVTVTGLAPDSAQGDRAVLSVLERFGAQVCRHGGAVSVSPRPLSALELDARDIPDLVPPLALVAACACGVSRIYGAQRLRIKESDRLESVAAALRALGGRVEILPDGLRITGGGLTGGTIDSQNDHRIAMLGGIASAICPVTILGAQAVEKSCPRFWQELSDMRQEEDA